MFIIYIIIIIIGGFNHLSFPLSLLHALVRRDDYGNRDEHLDNATALVLGTTTMYTEYPRESKTYILCFFEIVLFGFP